MANGRLAADGGGRPDGPSEAKETGVPPKNALAWRAAAFIVPDVAFLIQDGSTLEAAVDARHEDTADDHCRNHRQKTTPARKAGCQSHVELKGAV